MKAIITLTALCSTILVYSQQDKKTKKQTKPIAEKIVGNDKDANGCIGSAGFVYSVVKRKCVQPWEAGTRFTNVSKQKDSGSQQSIFVILSDNKDKAEIIYGGTDKSELMNRVGKPTETNGTVFYEDQKEQTKIVYKNNAFWYYFQNKALYSTPKSSKNGFYVSLHSKDKKK